MIVLQLALLLALEVSTLGIEQFYHARKVSRDKRITDIESLCKLANWMEWECFDETADDYYVSKHKLQ
jgi:hypothetical protein